ncbi:MAG: hypothetical protein KA175_01705 [Flavobacteriales bacterium]|nr:hypothetical protein [Flavobacteriales bacterium]MBP6696302.1 hypothetical protein [Flavobacteriales bacterium]
MFRSQWTAWVLVLPLLGAFSGANASHLSGGDIRYTHLGGNSYRIEVLLYTKSTGVSPQPEIPISLGDGALDTLPLVETLPLSPNDSTCSDQQVSLYSANHTYTGPGDYTITANVINRNGGILNVPNSLGQSICLKARLVIDPQLGPNTSARFQAPQNAVGYLWSTLVHNPLPTDSDGDSLSLELITPDGLSCDPLPGYITPAEVPSPDPMWNYLDPQTGRYQWYHPQLTGQYVIAIHAREWRNGMLIGEVTRDMSICISSLFSVTGVEEPQAHNAFMVFPGPEAGVFRVLSTSAISLAVVDALGRRVEEHRMASGEQRLDLRDHTAGSYVLVAVSADGRRSTQGVMLP